MPEIILNNGFKCTVDDEDYIELSKYKWGIINNVIFPSSYGLESKYSILLETLCN